MVAIEANKGLKLLRHEEPETNDPSSNTTLLSMQVGAEAEAEAYA